MHRLVKGSKPLDIGKRVVEGAIFLRKGKYHPNLSNFEPYTVCGR